MEFEFDLNNPIETLDNVPNEFQGHYEQTENGYVVSEGFKPIAKQINGLTSNLVKTRGKLQSTNNESAERRVKLSGFTSILDTIEDLEDKSPEALKSYLDDLRAKASQGGKAGEDAARELTAAKQAMQAAHATELGERDTKITALSSKIRTLLVDNQLTLELTTAKGNPKLLSPMLSQECDVRQDDAGNDVVVILDEAGQPRYNNSGDLLSIGERVAELKADPQFQAAFQGQVKGGSDAPTNTVKARSSSGGFDHANATGKSLIAEGMRKRKLANRR